MITCLLKKEIDNYIRCLEKLKEFEKQIKPQTNDTLEKSSLFNYKETIESLVEKPLQQLESFRNKVENMDNVLNRKNVEITLFGSVSVGKSCFMNVLLCDEIFMSASAHTTSCFVTVTRGDNCCVKYHEEEKCFDNTEDMADHIANLSTALIQTPSSLQNKEILQVFIKDSPSPILRNDVTIMDTPGADRQTKVLNLIKEQSQDSDIFIFILSNCLTDMDRKFFRYQTETSVRPDIFILVNKWDISDDDDDEAMERSKSIIVKECSEFIQKQTGENKETCESRIYFISTKEALSIKTKRQDYEKFTPKQQERYDQFLNFEEKLEEYINNPEQNKSRRYKYDIDELQNKMANIIQEFKSNFKKWKESSDEILKHLNTSKNDIENFKKELNEFIVKNIQNLEISALLTTSTDVDDINDAFDTCCKIINEKLNKLDKESEQKILNFLKTIENSDSMFKKELKNSSKVGTETKLFLRKTPKENLDLVYQVLPIVKPFFKNATYGAVYMGIVSVAEGLYNNYKQHKINEENKKILYRKEKELKTEVDSFGNDIYNHYEKHLNVIYEQIEESKKIWRNFKLELEKAVNTLD